MLRPATLSGLLSTAARPGRHVAVVEGNRRVRLAELDHEVTVLASALSERGVGTGTRVAVTVGGLDALACFFAVMRAGGTAVPMSPDGPVTTLQRIAETAGISALICADTTSQASRVIGSAIATMAGTTEISTGLVSSPLLSVHTMWAPARRPPADHWAQDGLAAVLCTTGTTGEPRPVLHTHEGLIASVRALEALHRSYFRGSPREVAGRLARLAWIYRGRLHAAVRRQTWCTPMPFHTIAGLRFMMQAILTGHRLVIPPRFHPRTLLETVASERISVLALTPTMLEAILTVRSLAAVDTSSLLVVGLGGAPAPASLIRRGEEALRCPVLNGYGSTETAGGILAARIGDEGDGSVGHPFPGTQVLIVDEAGNPVPSGTMGELICRTDSLMAGYGELPAEPGPPGESLPAEPAMAMPGDHGAAGWYRTGDLAMIDQRGAVHIMGRRRDLVIRGGMKIVPARVEKVLVNEAAVTAAAVVGIPDPLAGERTVAFVVPAAGAELRIPELLGNCKGQLSPHEVPDHMFVVAELPTAESGEVRKADLRRIAENKLAGRQQ